jgi:hypothetical protein
MAVLRPDLRSTFEGVLWPNGLCVAILPLGFLKKTKKIDSAFSAPPVCWRASNGAGSAAGAGIERLLVADFSHYRWSVESIKK